MIAALKGYRMKLLMPDNMSQERRAAMRAYGAELILVTKEQGMEGARDLALAMSERGEGKLLDQFNNPDNPYAHYTTTGPEIWRQTSGRITHFVSSMGTTGTITGVSRFLREQEKPVTIVGLQPEEGSSIPGIRRWPAEYMPGIFNASLVDEVLDIHQNDAENTMRELAVREGIFCGVSSGGAVAGALRVARATPGAIVVAIICDRGDRYLSTGVFGEEHFSQGQGFKLTGLAGWDMHRQRPPLTSGNILPIFYVRQRITAVFYNKSSSVVFIVVFVPGKASCNACCFLPAWLNQAGKVTAL